MDRVEAILRQEPNPELFTQFKITKYVRVADQVAALGVQLQGMIGDLSSIPRNIAEQFEKLVEDHATTSVQLRNMIDGVATESR